MALPYDYTGFRQSLSEINEYRRKLVNSLPQRRRTTLCFRSTACSFMEFRSGFKRWFPVEAKIRPNYDFCRNCFYMPCLQNCRNNFLPASLPMCSAMFAPAGKLPSGRGIGHQPSSLSVHRGRLDPVGMEVSIDLANVV